MLCAVADVMRCVEVISTQCDLHYDLPLVSVPRGMDLGGSLMKGVFVERLVAVGSWHQL